MNDFAKFFRLPASELMEMSFAVMMVPGVALALRLLNLRAIRRVIAATSAPPSVASVSAQRATRIAHLVSAAARRSPVAATCMARALTLHWLLRLRGMESSLRIGVRKGGENLEAHLWVEHDGVPLMEGTDPHEAFAPFEALPARLTR